VTVDGTTVPTKVQGTVAGVETLSSLRVTSCGDPVHLGAGEHRLTSGPQGGLVLTTAALAPAQLPPIGPARAMAVDGRWSDASRHVRVGPGAASYLGLTENFNKGWVATLHGKRLQPIRLDGWRQAWLVPAGAGGVVHLSFAPGHVYTWLLVAGVVGIVVLLELVWWPGRRRRVDAAIGRDDVARASSRVPLAIQVAAAVAVAFLLGGVVGVLVAAALLLLPRRQPWLPWLAGGAFALAGIAAFLSPGQFPGSGSGAFGAPAQLCAMVAVIAVAVSLVGTRGES
jgi:arabinofuranan 3-O-arabinosyltransferase